MLCSGVVGRLVRGAGLVRRILEISTSYLLGVIEFQADPIAAALLSRFKLLKSEELKLEVTKQRAGILLSKT